MNVLHILAQQPSRTGSGVYFTSIIEGLEKYGHQQRALFAFQENNLFTSLPPEKQYPVEFMSPTLPFPIVGMSDVMPYENTLYAQMTPLMLRQWKDAFTATLKQVQKEFQPDLIIAHHLWILTSLVLDIFPNTKVVGVCHNTDLRQGEQNPQLKEEQVVGLNRLDKVFTISDLQKGDIHNIFGIDKGKMLTLGGGFNEKIFYPPLKKETKTKNAVDLVFCGKIDESKGIFALLEAFSLLAPQYPTLTLDIIGEPHGLQKERLAQLINGHPRVRVYNTVNQQELGDVLRTKDIFAMPSFFEGLGLMAIESLATGLWVVASEIPGLMSLLGPDLNQCGIIEYVPLPRLVDTDKPVPEDLPDFTAHLATALEKQINKVLSGATMDGCHVEDIHLHSWKNLVKKLNQLLPTL